MKKHILVVDDNAMDVKKVCVILENEGLIPVVAKDGATALEMIQSHRFDMAVIDLQMPTMNGFKLTEKLRAHEETKMLPIIVMSGTYKAEQDVKAALLAGANDFVLKPIDSLMLTSKISRILTNQVDWGELSLSESGISPSGTVQVKIEVVSLSEMGIRILSTVPLGVKSVPQLSIPLFEEIEIPSTNLQVLECTKVPLGYESYLTFIGMPEQHLKNIRLFCRKLAAQRKNG